MTETYSHRVRVAVAILCAAILWPSSLLEAWGATQSPQDIVEAEIALPANDSVPLPSNTLEADTILTVTQANDYGFDANGKKIFNPDPERAVWLSALCPGLGQVYNRRYWKLPIVVGGFMGLGYATSWNNSQYQDYSQGYRDLLSNDPNAKSYMNFFPPNTREEDLDKTWLQQVMKSRKDFYRRNRDLCIISMVLLYLVCMVDAYVDASLAHFDISPDLAVDMQPAVMMPKNTGQLALGLNWSVTF